MPDSGSSNTGLIVGIVGGIAAALVPLSAVVIELIKQRGGRTQPSPPAPNSAPTQGLGDPVVKYRVQVLEGLAEDCEDAREIADRRQERTERTVEGHGTTLDRHDSLLEQIVRHLDSDHDGWR